MKQKSKCTTFIALFAVAVMFFGINSVAGLSSGPDLDEQQTAPAGDDAILDYQGVIYYFHAADRQLNALGTEGLPKYSPLLSPDGSKILYRYAAYDTDGILTVGIMDTDGNGIRDIIIDSLCGTEIMGMDWLDDQLIGVTCHVNPSTSEYLIYDATTGECVDSFAGYGFARVPRQTDIVYAANVPHWSDRMEYPRLMVDHTEIYAGDQLGAVLSTPIFSDDGSRMSFLVISSEVDEGGDAHNVRATLVQSTYDAAEKEIKITESAEIPGGYTNDLSYQGNELYISNDTGTYVLHGEKLMAASLHSAQAQGNVLPYDLYEAIAGKLGADAVSEVYDITLMK